VSREESKKINDMGKKVEMPKTGTAKSVKDVSTETWLEFGKALIKVIGEAFGSGKKGSGKK